MRLLVLFANRPDELVTREEVSACLWDQPQFVDVASGINTAVNRLRTLLGDDRNQPTYIETMIGVGYRFIAKVEWDEQPTTPAQPPAEQGIPSLDEPLPAVSDSPEPEPEPEPDAVADPLPPPAAPPARTPAHIIPRPADATTSALASSTKRNRAAALSVASIILILAAVAIAAALKREQRRGAEDADLPVSSVEAVMAQTTFNDADNPVEAQAVSPNGRMIVFSDRNGLTLRLIDRGADRLLAFPKTLRVQKIAWQPDNAGLLISTGGANAAKEVWSASLGGAAAQPLLEDAAEAAPSPDGRRIAFTRRDGAELWTAGARGDSPRQLAALSGAETYVGLTWSSEGSRLVAERRRVPVFPASANPLQQVQRDFHYDYVSLDAASGRPTYEQNDFAFRSAFFLGDGQMFFLRDKSPEEHRGSGLLVVKTDPETGRLLSEPRHVSDPGNAIASSVSASREGDVLAMLIERSSTNICYATVNLGGRRLEDVRHLVHPAPENFPHAWTADGKAIVFESNALGAYAIYKQRTDGSPAELMARSSANAVMPKVTPDGKWILFQDLVVHPVRRITGIYRIPVNGGPAELVPTSGPIDAFDCSHASTGVCVLREILGANIVYFALDPVLGQGAEIGRTAWTETMTGDWNVARDGKLVAMAIHDPQHPSIRFISIAKDSAPAPPDLEVNGIGTLMSSVWSADGAGFYVESKSATGYKLFYVDRSARAFPLREESYPVWGVPSPDGSEVAYGEPALNINLWIGRTVLPGR